MNKPLKLIPVGNSTGVVLPKEVLSRLHVDRGDQLFLTEAPDGSYRISAFDPEFAAQMEMAERIMREDREVLRALAK
jgi:putative addiction module antidote